MKIKTLWKFRTAKFYHQYERMYSPKQCLPVISWLLWLSHIKLTWTILMTPEGLSICCSLEREWSGCIVPFLQGSRFQNLIFSSELIYLPSPCWDEIIILTLQVKKLRHMELKGLLTTRGWAGLPWPHCLRWPPCALQTRHVIATHYGNLNPGSTAGCFLSL